MEEYERMVQMNICVFAGARPNFIKIAPLVHAMRRAKNEGKPIDYQLVYAGKDDDPTLESSLFDDLKIDKPHTFLDVEKENLNELTGEVMTRFDAYLEQHPAKVVVVVDDLASTMAASIVAKKRSLTLAHIAAGTRSFDIDMPKEINRLVIDGLSDLLFTAGKSNNSIANKEGAALSKIYCVGNILIDNIRFNHDRLRHPRILSDLGLKDGQYLVLTLNRKALINDSSKLKLMIDNIVRNSKNTPIIAPLRQKAAQAVENTGSDGGKIHYVEPMPYLDFMYTTSHAAGIITDSGNVAEEATFNGVPCITLNDYTEHIETVSLGTNVLVGDDTEKLQSAMKNMVESNWKTGQIPDRWDGRSAERIVKILLQLN